MSNKKALLPQPIATQTDVLLNSPVGGYGSLEICLVLGKKPGMDTKHSSEMCQENLVCVAGVGGSTQVECSLVLKLGTA